MSSIIPDDDIVNSSSTPRPPTSSAPTTSMMDDDDGEFDNEPLVEQSPLVAEHPLAQPRPPPLVQPLPVSANDDDDDDDKENNEQQQQQSTSPKFSSMDSGLAMFKFNRLEFWDVSAELRKQAVGAAGNQVLGFSSVLLLTMAVGRLDIAAADAAGVNGTVANTTSSSSGGMSGSLPLASVGVGLSTYNLVSLSVAIGFQSCLDTLISQAYGRGAESRDVEVAQWTVVGLVASIAMCVPLSILLFFFGPAAIGILFGARYVLIGGQLLRWCIPAIFMFSINNVFVKSLQASHMAEVPLRASVASALVVLIASLTLVPAGGASFCGVTVAISLFCSSTTQLIANILLSRGGLYRSLLSPEKLLDRDALAEIWAVVTVDRLETFFSLGAVTYLACASEWLAFEILAIICARLGEEESAAWSIFINIATLVWCVSGGLALASSSHVGKELGAKSPQRAAVFASVSLVWSVIAASTCSLIYMSQAIFGDFLFRLYTHDGPLLNTMHSTFLLFLLYTLGDGSQYTISGAFRGAGTQEESVRPILFSLWIVGLPSAWFLGHVVGFGLGGVIFGFCCGLAVESPLLVRIMLGWNWDELAEKAAKEHEKEGAAEEEDVDEEVMHHTEVTVVPAMMMVPPS